MAVATPDYEPIVTRVRSQVPGFAIVDFAATYDALRDRGVLAMPAGFVLPDAELSSTNKLASGVHQKVVVRFFVYLFVKFAGDALGSKAKDLVKPLRDPLFEALLAWNPPGADGVIEFAGGRTEQLRDGVLVWRDAFAFETFYRRVP